MSLYGEQYRKLVEYFKNMIKTAEQTPQHVVEITVNKTITRQKLIMLTDAIHDAIKELYIEPAEKVAEEILENTPFEVTIDIPLFEWNEKELCSKRICRIITTYYIYESISQEFEIHAIIKYRIYKKRNEITITKIWIQYKPL